MVCRIREYIMKPWQRLLKDWTIIGLIGGTVTLLVSAALGGISAGNRVTGALLSIWIVMLFISYGRILEVLAEVKTVLEEIKNFRIEFLNAKIAQDLTVISVEDFVQR